MFERIAQFRRALEARLRNTVKYAEQGERGLASRARDLVSRMEALLFANPERYARATVPVAIEPVTAPWSERQLAPQRQARVPVEATPLAKRPHDPIYEFRKRMRADYLERISPSPQRVKRFLERVAPPHHATEARFIEIRDVDDFLAFDAARRYALTKEVPALLSRDFELECLPDSQPHDSEWLRCSNFVVRHRGSRQREGA